MSEGEKLQDVASIESVDKLSEEVRKVSRQVNLLTEVVLALRSQMEKELHRVHQTVNERMDRLELVIHNDFAEIDDLITEVSELGSKVRHLRADVAEHEVELRLLKKREKHD